MKNMGLTASLAVNVILAALALVPLLSHGPQQESLSKNPLPPQDEVSTAASSQPIDARKAYNGLLGLGLSDASAKRALIGVLQAQRQPAMAEYWRGSHVSQVQERVNKYQTDASVRKIVLDTFGLTAVEAAGFEAVFKPLQSEFPTLSSQRQLAILEVEQSLDEKMLAQLAEPAGRALSSTIEDARDHLASVLNSEELFEYDIRHSLTAQRLAASGFAFTEREFRDVFAIYSAGANVKDRRQLQPTAMLEPKLRAALGPERYELFARTQDPAFRTLVSVARSHGLSQEKVEAAYLIVRKAMHESSGIDQQPGLRSERKGASKVDRRSDDELMILLGKPAYEQYSSSAALLRMRPTMVASPALN